jgi:hypothetical protein
LMTSYSSTSSPKEEEQHQQQQEDIHILDWFLSQKRKQRSNQRKQMHDIIKAVKEFEKSTDTKVPDLLSELLQRKSKPMIEEATHAGVSVYFSIV